MMYVFFTVVPFRDCCFFICVPFLSLRDGGVKRISYLNRAAVRGGETSPEAPMGWRRDE